MMMSEDTSAAAGTMYVGAAGNAGAVGNENVEYMIYTADGVAAAQAIAGPGDSMALPASTNDIKHEQHAEAVTAADGTVLLTSNDADSQPMLITADNLLHMNGQEIQNAAASSGDANAGTSVVMNANNSAQTVTIVPSDSGNGEISYVVIVSDPNQPDANQSIYDFNEAVNIAKKQVASAGQQNTATNIHMCQYCNYTTNKRYLLHRHVKSHMKGSPHRCTICDRTFKTMTSLQNHLNTHTGTRPHKCPDCENTFTTSGELVRHIRYKHTFEKPHKCTECDYCSVELSKLKRHMRCHTGERPYQCPHCTYASPDTFKLKRHLRVHTGEKPYECDVCHVRFTQSNSLKAHRMIHSGDKPQYQCELCPTTCSRKSDLRIHVQKLHTSDKPLECKKCGKYFPDRYTYRLHNKSHEGEKCFRCDLCDYSALTIRHLESHMLVHTQQKPYQCEECGQKYRQKQLLKRHINLYHNPEYVAPEPQEKCHECVECGKMFRHKGNLIRHLVAHDPNATEESVAEAHNIHEEDDEYAYFDGGSILDSVEEGQQVILINVSNAETAAEAANAVNPAVNANGSFDLNQFMSGASSSGRAGSNIKVNSGDGRPKTIMIKSTGGGLANYKIPKLKPRQQVEVEEDGDDGGLQAFSPGSHDEDSSTLKSPPPPSMDPVDPEVRIKQEMDTCFGFDVDDDDD